MTETLFIILFSFCGNESNGCRVYPTGDGSILFEQRSDNAGVSKCIYYKKGSKTFYVAFPDKFSRCDMKSPEDTNGN